MKSFVVCFSLSFCSLISPFLDILVSNGETVAEQFAESFSIEMLFGLLRTGNTIASIDINFISTLFINTLTSSNIPLPPYLYLYRIPPYSNYVT